MGTVHQLRRDHARRPCVPRRRTDITARKRLWPGLFLIAGILPIAFAVSNKAIAVWPLKTDVQGAQAAVATGVFVQAVDGDTLRTYGQKIRLIGIDAPEQSQTCRDAYSHEWRCGEAAKIRLAELVAHGGVNCTPYGEDKYGRALATCSAGTIRDLGEVLVREGYAVSYTAGNRGYTDAEREARSARRGIWQGDFELPRSWRQRHPYEDRKS